MASRHSLLKIKQALFSYKTATIADTKQLFWSLTSVGVSTHFGRCKVTKVAVRGYPSGGFFQQAQLYSVSYAFSHDYLVILLQT